MKVAPYVPGLLLVTVDHGVRSLLGRKKKHAVSPQELRNDVQKASTDRSRTKLQFASCPTEQGQKALKSSGADFTKVNRAVSH